MDGSTAPDTRKMWCKYFNKATNDRMRLFLKGVMQTNVGIEKTLQFGAIIQNMLPKSGDGRIMASPINPMAIQQQLKQMNPELSHDELVSRTRAAILQLQNLHRVQTPVILNENTMTVGQRQTTGYDQSYYQAVRYIMHSNTVVIRNMYPSGNGQGEGNDQQPVSRNVQVWVNI